MTEYDQWLWTGGQVHGQLGKQRGDTVLRLRELVVIRYAYGPCYIEIHRSPFTVHRSRVNDER